MSDEILEKLIEYFHFTINSSENVEKIYTENKDKLENIFQSLRELEIWKELSIESGYQISSHGRFKNPKGEIKNQSVRGLYSYVSIKDKTYSCHRLVASEFLEVDEKRLFVHHINAVSIDNRVANLKYVTVQENICASFETGKGLKKLRPVNEIDKDGNIIRRYKSVSNACKETGLCRSIIGDNCKGKTKIAKGRFFVYASKKEIQNDGQSVALYNIKNNIVKGPFISIFKASKLANVSYKLILKHVNKNKKYEDGSQWKKYYKPEDNEEKWLQFRNTIYEVSNLGKIRNRKTRNILKQQLVVGRHMVGLHIDRKKKQYLVYRLVHEVHNPQNFIPEYDVDHINGNCRDNRAVNLQSLTRTENIQKTFQKSILQIDINGNIIDEFKSIIDAENKFKIDSGDISKCAKKKKKTAGNFFWRYSGTYNEEEKKCILNITNVGKSKIVEQCDEFGNVISRWWNMTLAAKFCNVCTKKFKRFIDTDEKLQGFLWKFVRVIS